MTDWIFFPRADDPPPIARQVVGVFDAVAERIDSSRHELVSNEVLAAVRPGLEGIGFRVETGKTSDQKIYVPVLFGRNGKPEKAFDADAFNPAQRTVLEVEAGRAVTNNQFLKDLFQACMMHDVSYCAIAVRLRYRGNADFDQVIAFFDTLYASKRLALPLKGILLVGY